jgi:flagellar motor switch protein FliN/FliY
MSQKVEFMDEPNGNPQQPRGGQSPQGGPGQSPTGTGGQRPGFGTQPPPVSVGDDINVLLEQAERAISSINDPTPSSVSARPFELAELAGSPPSTSKASLNLLRDVELDLKIELGRSRMPIEELMKLQKGAVVPLDKLAGDPVDVYVNGRLVARGEVLVFNDNFCVRVAELVSGDQS